MIKPNMIPDEVVEAAAVERWGISEPTKWELDTCRIIIAAALNAWPGMQHKPYWDFRTHEKHTELILPVPQKEKGGQ